MDKTVRLAVIIGALLAGVGVFYHYVIFLPGVERARVALIEAEREQAKSKEEDRRIAYGACVAGARQDYDTNWAVACRAVAESRALDYRNCLKDKLVTSNQFLGKEYCDRTYGDTDPSPECSLPRVRSDSINATFKEAQERCANEARLGLQ